MNISARSYLTAGVAVLGAGAIALTPVQPTLSSAAAHSPISNISFSSVELAAATNPITRILEVWDTSETAFSALVNKALDPPVPTLQQVGANWLGYLADFNIPSVINSIVTNAQAALAAPFAADPLGTLDGTHALIYSFLPALGALQPIVDFTTTFTSGALIGLVGPFIAPIIAFGNSLQKIWTAVIGGQFVDAINEAINIPANLVDAFLNGGQTLSLTPVLDALGILPLTVPGAPLKAVVSGLGITLGGLLSPGGSLFNSLDLSVAIGPGTPDPTHIPGVPTGFIGSLIGLGQTIAKAIGWSGTGNPLHPGIPVPPAGAVAASSVAAPEAEAPDAGAPAGDTDAAAPTVSSGPAASGKASSGKPSKKSPAASSKASDSSSAGGGASHGKAGSKGHAA